MNLIVTSNVNTHSKVGMQNQKAIFRIQFLNEEKKNSGVHSKHWSCKPDNFYFVLKKKVSEQHKHIFISEVRPNWLNLAQIVGI